MNNLLEEIPSIPKIPSIAPLHLGITTRVMAKRQADQREKDKELGRNLTLDERIQYRRRSSKFMEGTAIPNSIIKADLDQTAMQPKDKATIKKERDEFVAELTERLQPQKTMHHSIYDEDVDREALNKIKKELQRRSLLPLTQDQQVHEDTNSSIANVSNANDQSVDKDPWEELKEKRRISRRTLILAPLNGAKRPTYDSIKKAIQNSKIIQHLLDVDNIEEQKNKQVQTGQSLLLTVGSDDSQNKPQMGASVEVLKTLKRDSSRHGKERKGSKRKSNIKSPNLSTVFEKSVIKPKSLTDTKRPSRKSTGTNLLKGEIEKPSGVVIDNILQQRKGTNT